MIANGAVIHALAGLLTASYAEDLTSGEADMMRAAAVAGRDEHDAMRAEIERLRALIPTCERGPKASDAEIQDLKNRLWAAETALALVPAEIDLRLEKLAESADREARICKKLLADTKKQIHRGGVIIAEQMAREIRAAQHKGKSE